MTRDIDFTELSLQDTLDLAIAIEEEARERYLEFVDQMVVDKQLQARSDLHYLRPQPISSQR